MENAWSINDDRDEVNVVENLEKVEEEMDLKGNQYIENLKIEEEIEKYSLFMIGVKSSQCRVSKAVKTQRTIFDVFSCKNKVLVCSKIINFLLKHDKNSLELYLRMRVFLLMVE